MLQPDDVPLGAELAVVSEANLLPSRNWSVRTSGPRHPTPSVARLGVQVSVVIAALNEAENLPYVFSRLPEGLHEIILVDGHSVDDTVAVARRLRPDVCILTQSGRGKGRAMA